MDETRAMCKHGNEIGLGIDCLKCILGIPGKEDEVEILQEVIDAECEVSSCSSSMPKTVGSAENILLSSAQRGINFMRSPSSIAPMVNYLKRMRPCADPVAQRRRSSLFWPRLRSCQEGGFISGIMRQWMS